MLVLRFLAGLPHGAYFGIAMLVAASLVPMDKRTAAVGRVLLGLTIATTIGVPLANGVGQAIGWRWAFAIVAGLALLTAHTGAAVRPARCRQHQREPVARIVGAGAQACLADAGDRRHRLRRAVLGRTPTWLRPCSLSPTPRPRWCRSTLCVFGAGLTAGNIIVPRLPTAR